MPFHILIADEMHASLLPMLDELGITYEYIPDIDRGTIKSIIGKFEGLIIRSKTFVDDEILSNASSLKVVCRAGAGVDNLDKEAMERRGIKIINTPEGNRDAVAEHCMAMLLNLFNKILQADRQVRNRIWDREGNRGIELKNKVVGIIGFGNMGSAFAKRLKAFGCTILGYDKYKRGFGDGLIQEADLEEIFQRADIVSFHIPLTAETRFWVDEEFIARFQKPVYLINTSRGEIISLKTIVNGLNSGKIAGAALDVLENEKLEEHSEEQKKYFNQLINLDQVILTPHVAGWSLESYVGINKVIIDKLKRLFPEFEY